MTVQPALERRRALITGASGAIGRVIARRFVELGCALAILGRSTETLHALRDELADFGGEVAVVPCDVTDPAAVDQAVIDAASALGGLDIVVNNAGGARFMADLADVRADGFTKVLALNLVGPFSVARAAVGVLAEHGSGSIVNVASAAGLKPLPGLGHYGAAKAGLLLLTRAFAREWARAGIRVNAVAPGFVDTPSWDAFRDESGTASILDMDVPIGRWVTSEEVANAVAFLASDAASGITGVVLPVDGGLAS